MLHTVDTSFPQHYIQVSRLSKVFFSWSFDLCTVLDSSNSWKQFDDVGGSCWRDCRR